MKILNFIFIVILVLWVNNCFADLKQRHITNTVTTVNLSENNFLADTLGTYLISGSNTNLFTVPNANSFIGNTITLIRNDSSNNNVGIVLPANTNWKWYGSNYNNTIYLTQNGDKLILTASSSNTIDILQYDSARYFQENPVYNSDFSIRQKTTIFGYFSYHDRWASPIYQTGKYGSGQDYDFYFLSVSGDGSNSQRHVIGQGLDFEDTLKLRDKKIVLSGLVKFSNTNLPDTGIWKAVLGFTTATANSNFYTTNYTESGSVTFNFSNDNLPIDWTPFATPTLSIPKNSNNIGIYIGFQNATILAETQFYRLARIQINEGSLPLPFKAPDSSRELIRCQRYLKPLQYKNIPLYYINGANNLRFNPLSYRDGMRTVPTIINTSALIDQTDLGVYSIISGTWLTTSSYTLGSDGGESINAAITSHGITGNNASLKIMTNKLFLNAEL